IGFATAKRFAEEGASVVVTDLKGHEEAALRLREEGLSAIGLSLDVSSDQSVDDALAQVIEKFGRIDILVNNAAISAGLTPGAFEDADIAEWQRVLDVNVVGVFRT